jgi:hypothetical protein
VSPFVARRIDELMAACQTLGGLSDPSADRAEARRLVSEKLAALSTWIENLEAQAGSADDWRRKAEGFSPPPWAEKS